ncbi:MULTISPECIES: peptidylprolyl isomerase [unclassified Lysobacter]|uniref:peptidylprolyl isomerase n=1 Tax=unclassified Lysobacter TaxID=2635362 RepID=UPI0006FC00F2|nr:MULTISPECIES: peptidylprolyl isomerase [unclassified Lysobacter]KQZ66632.1 molecular chaperone SurA [Lysobacter sp. Root559]KRC32784.1 molecular chaperone SurA [Lysobacter sp. Root76]KRD67873.1 molecular chaperone SurA [Lysobacter sp. Root96]
MKKLFACVLAAGVLSGGALLPVGAVFAQEVQPIDRIAAVVDEDVVLKTELDRAVTNILAQYAGREGQLPPRDVLERQVLERLILLKIQVAYAQNSGVRVTDQEIDQAIAGIAQQNRISLEQLRQQLARDGGTYSEFRTSIRDELLTQRLRQRFAQTRVSVSDAEIDAALAAQANSGTQYHLAHILVGLPEGATAEQIATAQKKIEGVKALIDKGEMDFAAAAVRYSDSPNALEGGDLGWRSTDEIPNAFAELMRGMSAGQVTAPIRGPSGFQLLKLVETRDASQSAPSMVTQYKARHILVRTSDTVTDAQAKAKADTLRARLAGGADFAEVVKDSEDLNSRGKGGDLGWFSQDEFGPEFGSAVAALQDNQISQPVRTPAGWHIIERTGSRQTDVGDRNRRAQVQETIGRRKLEDEWNRFLRERRGEAFVDIRVGKGAAADAPAAPASGG